MLIGIEALFQVAPTLQRRHAHAVVIDQFEMALAVDEYVAVLQVTMHDLVGGHLVDHLQPYVGGDRQRFLIAFATTVAHPAD